MKKAGVIAASVLFIVVLVILAVHNGLSNKKGGGADYAPPPNTSSVQSSSQSSSPSSYDIGMYVISNESLLDYSSPVIETQGTVSGKHCYLDGTQVVYLITITLDEINSSTVKYYCSYQVYNSVEKGTRLSVSYQKLTESSFSVYSVTAI